MEALRYKLRTFGIPIDGLAEVTCDNQSVVNNLSAPISTLKKIHNSIFYHRVRESQVDGFIPVGCIGDIRNLVDFKNE